MPNDHVFLCVEQAQGILPMSRSWYAKQRWQKTGPAYVRCGSKILYPRDALIRFALERVVRPRT